MGQSGQRDSSLSLGENPNPKSKRGVKQVDWLQGWVQFEVHRSDSIAYTLGAGAPKAKSNGPLSRRCKPRAQNKTGIALGVDECAQEKSNQREWLERWLGEEPRHVWPGVRCHAEGVAAPSRSVHHAVQEERQNLIHSHCGRTQLVDARALRSRS